MLITTGNLCFDSGGMVKSFPKMLMLRRIFAYFKSPLSQQTGHRVISIYVVRKWAILFLVDACSLLIPPKRSAPEHLPERWYFRAAQLRLLWVITECIFQFLIINSVQTCCSKLPYKLQSQNRKGHHRLAKFACIATDIYVKELICTRNNT